MRLADALVETLAGWDLRYAFGVSGANIEHFHDAVHRLGGTRLRSVMARSEVGAAFMADARARVHRTLGLCCATSGGGMMNLAVGLAESYAESVPVLAIVGQVPTTLEGKGGFQDGSGIGRTVDATRLFGALAKQVARLDDAASFWARLEDAVRTALSGRPGPAVLLVPRDAWERQVPPRPAHLPARLDDLRTPAPLADDATLDRLFAALAGAKRPVLVLGTGVERSTDPDAVRRFAVHTGTPVVTTMASTGAFPNEHPLYLGTIGAAGHPSAHAYVNHRADLLLAVGTGLDAMTRGPIAPGLARARVAVVNVDAAAVRRILTPELIVEADAGLVFAALGARLAERPFRHAPPAGYALTRFVPMLDETPGTRPQLQSTDAPSLRSSEAIALLSRYLPERGHILFDAGNCAATALHHLDIPAGASTTIALGQGGMGYAISAATGVQLGAAAGARTLVVCGDGAFLMLGPEVHTAVDLRLRVLFVVMNDQQHGMCVTRQKLYFDGRTECSRYAALDAAQVARGFGPPERLWVGQAASPAQLLAKLAEYHADGAARPGLLEVRLSRAELPPFTPFLDEHAPTFVARPAVSRPAASLASGAA
jgi:acetolactate synthase-1/2/3 large subunit